MILDSVLDLGRCYGMFGLFGTKTFQCFVCLCCFLLYYLCMFSFFFLGGGGGVVASLISVLVICFSPRLINSKFVFIVCLFVCLV